MSTAVAVEKRIVFNTDSLTSTTQYHIVCSVTLIEKEVIAELKKRGYTKIEVRYYSAAWP